MIREVSGMAVKSEFDDLCSNLASRASDVEGGVLGEELQEAVKVARLMC